ncbi:MAG: c-type cytochrome, partial [Sphingobium sp.]
KIRSADTGDNLFLCSIVALDAVTGKYKWHYQINPGETWDYNAAMDMHLADLTIDGKPRKVLMQAPKNGFTYVIDRISGKLISAEKIAKVTWASHIDLTTGRPVETPGARFPDGQPFEMWPGVLGAHGWLPSSFSPRTGLMYIPVMERGMLFSDKGITPGGWRRTPGKAYDFALNLDFNVTDPLNETSWLKAYDPVARRIVWSVKTPGLMSGGTMATAGALVFQGDVDSNFNAYAADTGRKLWTFRTQAPTFSAPISYAADGVQYVTVVTGVGTTAGHATAQLPDPPDYRGQHRRVLTFRIGGKAALPARTDMPQPFPADASFRPDAGLAQRGAILFGTHCAVCHGTGAISGGGAPDLRRSPVSYNAELFTAIVHGGGLVSNGMPRFGEIKEEDLRAMQHYLREEGRVAREGRRAAP